MEETVGMTVQFKLVLLFPPLFPLQDLHFCTRDEFLQSWAFTVICHSLSYHLLSLLHCTLCPYFQGLCCNARPLPLCTKPNPLIDKIGT